MAQTQQQQSPQRWSHAADEILRTQFLKEARAKCRDKIEEFVECSKKNGLLVILRCRAQNKEMNACVSQYTSEESYVKYRNQRVQQLQEKGVITGGVAEKPSF